VGIRAGVAIAAIASAAAAAPLRTSDVVDRLTAYIDRVDERLASVVAEEHYRQTVEDQSRVDGVTGRGRLLERREIRSDYALVRAADGDGWVGFRDTFEVDGKPVRDREDRLQRLVARGDVTQAARIATESARFNLGGELVVRNINVPTFVLRLLHPVYRDRFAFNKVGEETIDGVRTWQIRFRERDRPTIVRRPDGRDQPSSGSVWVEPVTGEVWKTLVMWDVQSLTAVGRITVTYGRVAGIDLLVPVLMDEAYPSHAATLEGHATYSNYRQFQTGARIVSPQ
jgi:hypothetical protein